MMLFTCGNVMRQPDAAERTRQKGRMLLGILIIFMLIPVALGFASSLARPTSQPDAVSPLLVFVAGMAIVCISMPYGTAKSLGTSVRQRRVWMLVGAAIAFVEIVALVAVTVSDLKSADPSVRKEAAKLLGSFAGPTGQGADLADDRTAANPALNGEPRSAHAAPPGPFPPAPPGTLIELERTECLGTCPAYTVTLNELGEVTFEGRKFVTTNGSATGAASQREVARLVATVRAHGLFDLEDSYFCPVTDFPTVRVRVVLEGRTKKISHDLGCEMVRRTDPSASGPPPAWLTSFENRIDQVAGTERWIGMGRDAADRDATRL
jgi:hypothetical protein